VEPATKPQPAQNILYLLRSETAADGSSSRKSLLICLPRRMATKAVFDALNRAYGWPCGNKTTSLLTRAAVGNDSGNNASRCITGDFDSMRHVIQVDRLSNKVYNFKVYTSQSL
jgi:hypothetical protein